LKRNSSPTRGQKGETEKKSERTGTVFKKKRGLSGKKKKEAI